MTRKTRSGSKDSRKQPFRAYAPVDWQPSEADQVGKAYAAVKTHVYSTSEEKPLGFWQAQVNAINLGAKVSRSEGKAPEITSKASGRPRILILENDEDLAREYGLYLGAYFVITYAHTPSQALTLAAKHRHFVAVVIDVRMPPGDFFGGWETAGGSRTGLEVGAELAQILPEAILVGLSRSDDALDAGWFEARGGFYCQKDTFSPARFARHVYNLVMKAQLNLKSFIVHGRDREALLDLKNYLQNRLHMPEPVILFEKASGSLTVIEKFEKHADDVDVAFVLMTPDDFNDAGTQKGGRARQNVVFELGYFVGFFGRRSGRVILLAKGDVEIPSDLAGIVYINISAGIAAAGEEIRAELEAISAKA